MKKVIIFNAPPKVGKGVAAEAGIAYLQSIWKKAQHKSFKTPLIELTARFLGITVEEFLEDYDKTSKEVYGQYGLDLPSDGGWWKDVKLYTIYEKEYSKREALIHVSENVMKPVYGKSVFGVALANSLEDGYNLISDGGFKEELAPVIEAVGIDNVTVVRIHMEGRTFEGDSRNYIQEDWFEGLRIIDVDNVWGEQEAFEDKIIDILSKL